MGKKAKKFLSLLSAALMVLTTVFSGVDASAFATETEGTTETAAVTVGTKLASIEDGSEFVLYINGYAMTGTASGTGFAGVEAAKNGDTLTVASTDALNSLVVLKASKDADGNYTFTSNGKYLTSGKTGNSMTFADEASDYSLWTLDVRSDGTTVIVNKNATYTKNGTAYNEAVEYYGGFTTYNYLSTYSTVTNYAAEFYSYAPVVPETKTEDSVSGSETTEPATDVTAGEETVTGNDKTETGSTETETAVSGTKLTELKDGDQFVVTFANSTGTYIMSSVASSKKLAGVAGTVANDVLTVSTETENYDKLAVLTASVDENGYYTFTATVDGAVKYLTSGKTGNSITLADAASDYSLWTVKYTEAGWLIGNKNASYTKSGTTYSQYIEYYNGFTTYNYLEGTTSTTYYLMNLYTAPNAVEPVKEVTTFVIYNAANKMALSSNYSGNYNAGVEMTLNDKGSFDSVKASEVWNITKNDDGTVKISQGDNVLSMDTSYSSMPLNKVNDKWELTENEDGTYYIKNVGRSNYIEWYATKSNWSSYSKITDTTKALFAQSLIPVTEDMIEEEEVVEPAETANYVADGTYYLYSASAAGVMKYGLTAGCAANVAATVADGAITTESASLKGAAVLTLKYDTDKAAYVIACGSKYLAANSSEELYLADALSDTTSNCTYWVLEKNSEFSGYALKSRSVTYNSGDVYCEYYSSKGFCLYTAKAFSEIYFFDFYSAASDADTDGDGYAYGTVPVAQPLPTAGKTVVISNDANSQVIGSMIPGTDGSESSMGAVDIAFAEDGTYSVSNGALIFTMGNINEFKITGDTTKVAYFTVEEDANGKLLFVNNGKYLTTTATGSNITLEATANDYSLWTLEAVDGASRIKSVNALYKGNTQYIEYFSSSKYKCFKATGYNASYENYYNFKFYDANGNELTSLKAGDVVCFANVGGSNVWSTEASTGTSASGNFGAVEASASASGYYYFENNGLYLATNNDEELLVQSELDDMAQWELVEVLGGYLLKSKSAAWTSSSGNKYPIYIEYFSGAFAGYSYKATSADIFTFNLYSVDDTYGTGYVINPSVKFNTNAEANIGVDYTLNFTLDDLGTITKTGAYVTFEDGTSKDLDITMTDKDGKIVIGGSLLKGHSSMTVTVSATSQETENVSVDFEGSKTIKINDEPAIVSVSPAANAQTGTDKQPEISFTYANIGDNAVASLTVNGEAVELVKHEVSSSFAYTPAEALADGKYTVCAVITRADGKSVTKTWSFNVGYSGVQLYFGQIHSHTAEYSDGSGTLEQAFEYSMYTAADCDYMIVTDHSNYFDTTASATKDSIYDDAASSISMSTTTDADGNTLNLWQEAKATAAYYNSLSSDFVAAYGYEMTWSGGPGHINVFNSKGIVSRNNTELNNKTNNSGMLTFYDLLVDANDKGATSTGDSAISGQFNHPGTTFGYFDSFTGWTTERDEIMNLIEVGNGDGAIGGTAYFPSYEYYDMCLTAGWHVAPTNGQDNHKGSWGDSNTARTVALTSDFTESGLYDAMTNRQIYSTEDQNLSVVYYLNDELQGSIIDPSKVGDTVKLSVSLSDADTEALGYVYVIGLDGKVLYTSDFISDNTADLSIELKNTDPYYYVKVVEKDGDIAVTAPVWVDDVVKASNVAAALTSDTEKPVVNTEVSLSTSITNGDAAKLTLKSLTVTVDGKTLKTVEYAATDVLATNASKAETITWAPDTNGMHTIRVAYTYTVDDALYTKTATKNIYVKGTDYDTVYTTDTLKTAAEGTEFTIEGYITANTSGYDKNTAFFDCTYIQDANGGINVFPVSDSFKIGQHVRAHGAITYYNGEIELNLSEDYGGYIEVIDDASVTVAATEVSTADAMSADNIGLLMTVTGEVTKIHTSSDVIDRIYVNDGTGETCVYINGYIWNSNTENFEDFGTGFTPVVGDTITVTGIGSVDVDELGEVDYLHRLRIRNRAEIVLEHHKIKNAYFYAISSGNFESISSEVSNTDYAIWNDPDLYDKVYYITDPELTADEIAAMVDDLTEDDLAKLLTFTYLNFECDFGSKDSIAEYLGIYKQYGADGAESVVENYFDPAELARLVVVDYETNADGEYTGNGIYTTGDQIDWYVLKDTSDGQDCGWHVDGLIKGVKVVLNSNSKFAGDTVKYTYDGKSKDEAVYEHISSYVAGMASELGLPGTYSVSGDVVTLNSKGEASEIVKAGTYTVTAQVVYTTAGGYASEAFTVEFTVTVNKKAAASTDNDDTASETTQVSAETQTAETPATVTPATTTRTETVSTTTASEDREEATEVTEEVKAEETEEKETVEIKDDDVAKTETIAPSENSETGSEVVIVDEEAPEASSPENTVKKAAAAVGATCLVVIAAIIYALIKTGRFAFIGKKTK